MSYLVIRESPLIKHQEGSGSCHQEKGKSQELGARWIYALILRIEVMVDKRWIDILRILKNRVDSSGNPVLLYLTP